MSFLLALLSRVCLWHFRSSHSPSCTPLQLSKRGRIRCMWRTEVAGTRSRSRTTVWNPRSSHWKSVAWHVWAFEAWSGCFRGGQKTNVRKESLLRFGGTPAVATKAVIRTLFLALRFTFFLFIPLMRGNRLSDAIAVVRLAGAVCISCRRKHEVSGCRYHQFDPRPTFGTSTDFVNYQSFSGAWFINGTWFSEVPRELRWISEWKNQRKV